MASLNQVQLIGNLGKDPEIRYSQDGKAVANFSVATSEKWTDKSSGETHEKTEWHRVVAFGKLAEIVGKYLRKGSKVFVQGALQTRKWEDKEGQTRYTTEVVLGFGGKMIMLGGTRGDGQSVKSEDPMPSGAVTAMFPETQGGQMPGGMFDNVEDDPF